MSRRAEQTPTDSTTGAGPLVTNCLLVLGSVTELDRTAGAVAPLTDPNFVTAIRMICLQAMRIIGFRDCSETRHRFTNSRAAVLAALLQTLGPSAVRRLQ